MNTSEQRGQLLSALSASIIILIVSLGVALGLWLGRTGYWQGQLCPGLFINSVAVGGLSTQQAQIKLERTFQSVVKGQVKLLFEGREFVMTPSEVGIGIDFRQGLAKAEQVGRQGSWVKRLTVWIGGSFVNTQLKLATVVEQGRFERWVQQVSASVERPARGAQLNPMANGKFEVEQEQNGIQVDRAKLIKMITGGIERLPRRLPLPVCVQYPQITEEKLHSWKIDDLLGSYTTAFDPNNFGRSHNVALAASALNQVVVQPKEVFSFVYHIRTKTLEQDYREAPVMVDGLLVEGKGGGICQVSTTLFNAALLANIQIVERNHHSLPVAYVPIGLDATVAGDYLDLKLKLKDNGWFYIVTEINQGQLTVYIYGKKNYQSQIRIEQSELEIVPPPTKVIRDTDKSQEKNPLKSGKQGYRISTWRIISNEGQVKKELIAKDYYKPIPREVYDGQGILDRNSKVRT